MLSEKEKQEKGYLWNDWDEYLEEQTQAKELLYDFNQSRPAEVDKRRQIMKKLFGQCGDHVWINQPMTLCRGKTIHIGDFCYFNYGTTFVDDTDIYIGNNVMFGPNVTICTTGHPIAPDHRQDGMYSFPVHIGNGCWIGAGAIILAGVSIGDNSVIGAGSVVSRDIPANVLAVGQPCRVKRQIGEYDEEYYFRGRRFADLPEQ